MSRSVTQKIRSLIGAGKTSGFKGVRSFYYSADPTEVAKKLTAAGFRYSVGKNTDGFDYVSINIYTPYEKEAAALEKQRQAAFGQ